MSIKLILISVLLITLLSCSEKQTEAAPSASISTDPKERFAQITNQNLSEWTVEDFAAMLAFSDRDLDTDLRGHYGGRNYVFATIGATVDFPNSSFGLEPIGYPKGYLQYFSGDTASPVYPDNVVIMPSENDVLLGAHLDRTVHDIMNIFGETQIEYAPLHVGTKFNVYFVRYNIDGLAFIFESSICGDLSELPPHPPLPTREEILESGIENVHILREDSYLLDQLALRSHKLLPGLETNSDGDTGITEIDAYDNSFPITIEMATASVLANRKAIHSKYNVERIALRAEYIRYYKENYYYAFAAYNPGNPDIAITFARYYVDAYSGVVYELLWQTGNDELTAVDRHKFLLSNIDPIIAEIKFKYNQYSSEYIHKLYLHIAFADINFDDIPELFFGYQTMTGSHNKIWFRAYKLPDFSDIDSEHSPGYFTYFREDDCDFFTGPDSFIDGYYLGDDGDAVFVTQTLAGPVTDPRNDVLFMRYSGSSLYVETAFENSHTLLPLNQIWSEVELDTLEDDISELLDKYLKNAV